MSVVDIASLSEVTITALSAFKSIGVSSSNLVILSLADYHENGDKVKGTGERVHDSPTGVFSIDELIKRVPATVASREARRESVILSHPTGEGITLLQLDDIPEDRLLLIQHLAFIVIQTSPGSFQAWLAWKSQEEDTEFKSRVRKLISDKNATGAVRIPGSRNFKLPYLRKYGEFPLIEITHVSPGRLTSREEIVGAFGLPVAIELPAGGARPAVSEKRSRVEDAACLMESLKSSATGNRWPSYKMCLDGSYADGKQQRHSADYFWCKQSFLWGQGYGVADVAARLMLESAKAQERGSRYATETATNALRAAKLEPDFEERWNRFVRAPRTPQDEREPSPRPATPPARSMRPDGPFRSADGYSRISPMPARPVPPGTPFDSLSVPCKPKAKIIAITENEVDARAIESASGITTVAVGRGIPSDLRVRCGLGKVLLATGDKLARHLEGILWGKMLRVRLPEGVRSPSEMDVEALRSLIAELAPEVISPVEETLDSTGEPEAVAGVVEALCSKAQALSAPAPRPRALSRRMGYPALDCDLLGSVRR
jgi:hypothetical protein